MFIVTLKYIKPLSEVEKFLDAHRSFLGKYYESNDLVCSGPKNPRDGGIIIARTKDRSALEKILTEDPFQINQIATYEIIEFTPVKFSKAFEGCL